MIQGDIPSSGGSTGPSTPTPPAKQPLISRPSEAGSSTSPIRHLSTSNPIPDSTPTDETESSTIKKHLDRRRKSIHLPGRKKASVVSPTKDDHEVAAWHEQLDDMDDVEAEESERVGRSVTFDMEELRRTMPDAVKMLKGGKDWKGSNLDEGLERGFVWDVMFENQRGIHFLGKAYFTSNSLLPSDPSQYTLPGTPIPSASTLMTTNNPESNLAPAPSTPKRKIPRIRKPGNAAETTTYKQDYGEHSINLSSEHRNIKTAYSLATFQCPGPQWEWITPWMINMKVGTDEGGWRYNAWFKKKGWRNHAGRAGWWGWVRRREWVRLRMVVPIEEDDGEELTTNGAGEHEGAEGEKVKTGNGKRKGMADIVRGAESEECAGQILHTMSSISLDREKIGWWEEGLQEAEKDDVVRKTVQTILDDGDYIKLLHRAFTHRSTFSSFLSILDSHNYTTAPLTESLFLSAPNSEFLASNSDPKP